MLSTVVHYYPRFYNIFMYLNNKNILQYAQILGTSGRFIIFHIEGHSNSTIVQFLSATVLMHN